MGESLNVNPIRLKMGAWVLVLGDWFICRELEQSVTSGGKSKLILGELGSATGVLVCSRRRQVG